MTDAALIALIVQAYAMREQDVTTLAGHLATARLAAMQRAYRKAQHTVHALPIWEPDKRDIERAQKQAHTAAASIAETYRTLLSHFLARVLEVEKQRKGVHTASWADLYGSVREAVRDLVGKVKTFVSDLAGWKAPQVANYTCGQGNNAGTNAFIDDALSGDMELDEDSVSIVNLAVLIMPETSSPDECADIAGLTFSFSEWQDMGIDLPMHESCPHEAIVTML